MSRSNFTIILPETQPEPPPSEMLHQYPLGTVIGTADGYWWTIADDHNHDGERYYRRNWFATRKEDLCGTHQNPRGLFARVFNWSRR